MFSFRTAAATCTRAQKCSKTNGTCTSLATTPLLLLSTISRRLPAWFVPCVVCLSHFVSFRLRAELSKQGSRFWQLGWRHRRIRQRRLHFSAAAFCHCTPAVMLCV